jgi:hypothetical protein
VYSKFNHELTNQVSWLVACFRKIKKKKSHASCVSEEIGEKQPSQAVALV